MITVTNDTVHLKGSLPELFDDFTIIMTDLKDILINEFDEDTTFEILSILGKVAFLDESSSSYKEDKNSLYSKLVGILNGDYAVFAEREG